MVRQRQLWLVCGLLLVLVGAAACSGAGGDSILGTGEPGLGGFDSARSAPDREDLEAGVNLAADPESIDLDPCDPDAPMDDMSGKLLGKTSLGAILLGEDRAPLVGVEVVFSTTAGMLESMGQPVLTNERGLATDTLAVDEDDAGDVVVTATSARLGADDTVTVPVTVLPESPLTLEMDPAYLWPPNHRLRDVTAVFGGLDCRTAPTIELVSVTSNEPDNGNGDGNTDDDIEGVEIGTADTEFQLRAERAGGGDGRVYTVTYRLMDEVEGMSMLSATVRVPHDRGN